MRMLKVLGLAVGLTVFFSASASIAQDLNPEHLLEAGKRVQQVQAPRQYQLFHVTPKEVPNASVGASHGELYMKSEGKIRRVADDVVISRVAPDGKTYFSDNSNHLKVLDASGSVKTIAENVDADFTFDKTGKQILVVRPLENDITTMDLIRTDGKLIHHILPEGNNFMPRFTPDGKSILFASGDTGIISWYLVDIQGTNKRQLTNIGMVPGQMTDDFVPIMSTPQKAEFIDDTHFKYLDGNDVWILDITTGHASKPGVR